MTEAANTWSTATAKIPAPVSYGISNQASRQDFEKPYYVAGPQSVAVSIYGHYTSDEKSNSIENAAYDFGSAIPHPYAKALTIPSTMNSARNFYHGNISPARYSLNLVCAGGGLFSPYGGIITGTADIFDSIDENWFDGPPS